ncbi:MAG: MarR family transcriptional regulator, partial [Betaproteobacteria bacterium]
EKMEIGEPAIVALIDRLEKDEFIVRNPVPGDRRARSLALTVPGKRLISKIEAVVEALREELMTGFSVAQLKTTSDVLAQIKQRIETFE